LGAEGRATRGGMMSKVTFDISMSLDGFVAGPEPGPDQGLGKGGEQLHEWVVGLASWREAHGKSGGETGVDDDVSREMFADVGAVVMGRGMFSAGDGPWEDDPVPRGWWGDEPPFHMPVFVLTHHTREPLEMEGGTTFHFVTDGVGAAVERAREAAGEKEVLVAGGASAINQSLRAGLVDEFQVHVVPVMLGGGARLFEDLGDELPEVESTRVLHSPAVTHLRYRVVQ
jgi:dihydrofolate reductase